MLWSMMRLIFKTSSVTPDFFYVFNLILSFPTYGESFEKICAWELLGANVLKALIAIFWDLQPLWWSWLTKPDLLRFRCSSGHVISKTKSVTPHFFYISDIANSPSFNGKIFRKKSMLEKFRANVLNQALNNPALIGSVSKIYQNFR